MKTVMEKNLWKFLMEGQNMGMLRKVMKRFMQNQELFGTAIRLLIVIRELKKMDKKYNKKLM